MSSQGHRFTSGSLPSDYAMISGYGATAAVQNESRDDNDNEGNDMADDLQEYPRPRNPAMASVHRRLPIISHTERTPLIGTEVPRIHEEVQENGSNNWFAEYIEELKILTKYTIPVFGTHVLEYSLVISGIISIGHLSTTALAAATLATMTANVSGFSVIQGFVSALDTLLPSAWSSGHPTLVGLWCLRISIIMTCLLFPILMVWFNSEAILLLLKQDTEVAHLASIYLKYLSIGLPAYAVNNISRRYFQSQGLFTVPTRIILIIAPINVALNYLLVWGPEPFRLGFIGAPLASAISFNLIALSSIMYGIFFAPKTAWHPFSSTMFQNLGLLMKLGVAGVGQVGSEWWSWELIGLAASFLGPVALATQSVLLVSASTTFQAPFALSVAASVRIGNLLGEANAKRAAIATYTSFFMALLIAAVWSAMFMIWRKTWGRIFNDDPAVLSMVSSVLPLVALFQVFDGVSAVVAGTLRALGRQTTGAILNVTAYYIIGIPLGVYLTFEAGMKIWGLWIGLTISLVYASVVGTYFCFKTDWNAEVKKVLDRIKADKHAYQPAGLES